MKLLKLFKKGTQEVCILRGPFKGARIFLDPSNSKRKILGEYEFFLNPWLADILKQVDVVWDVGANDGYFTYGCAKAVNNSGKPCHVVAFEPVEDLMSDLRRPSELGWYPNSKFEFVPKFVGKESSAHIAMLDVEYNNRPSLHSLKSLIKVDVEGGEVDVLEGASALLKEPHQWVVEVHGDHLLQPVLEYFQANGRKYEVIPLKPHWLFGPEQRTIKTCWVVTKT